MIIFSAATDVGPMSRIMSSGSRFSIAFSVAFASAENSFAQTASTGIGTLPGNASRIACASGTRSASTSDLPTWPCAARMNVFAIPPPTISASTFAASAFSTVSLVETFEPPTIATSGRAGSRERLAERLELRGHQRPRAGDRRVFRDAVRRRLGAMRGAERVVDVDIAELRHLARERVVVRLLALVEAAVLEQHDITGRERSVPRAAVHPVLDQGHGHAEKLATSRCATGASESASDQTPSFGRPRCEVTITAAPRASASRMPGTDARMRESSVIAPASSCGTFRSARMSTRFPRTSMSARRRKVIVVRCGSRAVASSRRRRGAPCARATTRAARRARR